MLNGVSFALRVAPYHCMYADDEGVNNSHSTQKGMRGSTKLNGLRVAQKKKSYSEYCRVSIGEIMWYLDWLQPFYFN